LKYLYIFILFFIFLSGNMFLFADERDFFTCGATLAGKVYIDENENGCQDEGEKGVEGAVIILENGIYVKSGPDGKFSIPNLTAGFHVVELDDWSLPPGIILISEEERTRFVNIPQAGMSVVNFRVKEDL